MAKSITYLLNNISSNTTGNAVKLPDYGGPLRSGIFNIFVWGTLGGGTVTIQVSPDDGSTWFTARSVQENQLTFTLGDVKTGYLKGTHVRAKLEGASGASGVYVGIVH